MSQANKRKCFSVKDGSMETDARVYLESCDGGLNQRFRFLSWDDDGDGYKIQAVHSGMCLASLDHDMHSSGEVKMHELIAQKPCDLAPRWRDFGDG